MPQQDASFSVAVDIGGTFTDLVGYDSRTGQFFHAKSLTTPHSLSEGIVHCLEKAKVPLAEVSEIIHGSTVAINAVIEERGAKTALVVTKGTRDVYSIGRGNRPQAYSLHFRRPRPLVPRELTFEVDERILGSGSVERRLDEEGLREAAMALKSAGVESAAVCLLHSYVNPEHERRIGDILADEVPDMYVSLSHKILREFREYERTSTTVVNAYITPVVSRYLSDLQEALGARGFRGRLWIMQSNGGVMAPDVASRKPVGLMESGPVGGIIAAARTGQATGADQVIAFDMGGTTAKASFVSNGVPTFSDGYFVGGYAEGHPVLSPVVDVVEVGTGGGSIAWLDEVGALKVGPRSAGAAPGPICYSNGGTEPTITDANVVLGRIPVEAFMGGESQLDVAAAYDGIDKHVAEPLGLDVVTAAHGVIEIANTKMSLAVREVSAAKGFDPREFTLIASGGAGPLHAMAIARDLHIPRVVVPRFPGHFSAVGMLSSDQREDMVQTVLKRLDTIDTAELVRYHHTLRDGVVGVLEARRMNPEIELETAADVRYAGQDFALRVEVTEDDLSEPGLARLRERFDELHKRRYGHNAPHEKAELVNLRVTAISKRAEVVGAPLDESDGSSAFVGSHSMYLARGEAARDVRVLDRRRLSPGDHVSGPALIQEYASTTVLFEGDRCVVSTHGDLHVTVAN